jgi:hypothetical protein
MLDQDRLKSFCPGVDGARYCCNVRCAKAYSSFSGSIVRSLSSRTLVKKSTGFTLGFTNATGAPDSRPAA